ncbi:TPA: hypothetical protein ACUOB4_000084 [Streptococcus pneumoniae]|uniref:hypothetical protein n=1 Tax=Streptococcus pneumoniae TaxID=1313 RepID=UPI000254B716|nr:hypothetical protein [Streptococcus pneumoniae]EHZ20199.1 hypothetical protein SPAR26_0178 [Streptococcus pneumoniae GA13224]MDS2417933.1 hypothetical protein [Streptococcus pneumoniae]MDS2790656.1 hypothetical protein [Streptococcus pneumoniae]MDS5263558.1 hypothetical protein [Streptococcus pneumoniae]MDS5860581.1 hypothetical protein [Streptococcus pneumoniae]
MEHPVDVFSPVPLNKRELVGSGDVFSPALEIRNVGSLGDCISPTPRNGEELERPVNIFTPTLRN